MPRTSWGPFGGGLFLHVAGADHPAADHEALTTKKERMTVMKPVAKPVSKTTKMLFPLVITVLGGLSPRRVFRCSGRSCWET